MSPKNILIILSLFVFLQNCQSKDCACGRINSGRRSNNRIVNGDRRSSNRIVNGDRKSNNRIVNGDRRSNNRVVNGEEVNPPHKYAQMQQPCLLLWEFMSKIIQIMTPKE